MSVIRAMETIANHEEKDEFNEMEALLSSLLEEEIITGIEYRLIVSSRQLSDRQSAIFKLLDSKYKLEALKLDKFRKLNSTDNSQSCQPNEKVSENEKNPLLINTVITNLFEVLSFEDIKLCRLVCQQWNSTAEVWLRKKAAINFKPGSLEPTAFFEIFKFSLPHLPFTNFIFSNSSEGNRWCTSELDEFFNKWGDNIKSLTFNQIYLKSYKEYDVTSWVEKAKKLAKLKIDCFSCVGSHFPYCLYSYHRSYHTALELELDKVTSLKSLSANNCIITLDPTKSSPRFTPLEIELNAVTWKLPDGAVLDNITLNDFIDFGQAFKIIVRNRLNRVGTCKFDMACQVFDTRKFIVGGIDLVNWGTARGNMDLVSSNSLTIAAPNQLNFKQLSIQFSKVNLTFLPQCIEKLYYSSYNEIVCDGTIQLPNLKFLCYEADESCSRTHFENFLSLFSNCVNLSELELVGKYEGLRVDVDLIPRSVKKMKIRLVNFVGDNHYELDTLIIEEDSDFYLSSSTHFTKVMLKIKSRVLVVKFLRLNKRLKTSAIINFVKKNTQLERIVVGVEKGVDLHANVPFEGSILSRWVDQKSNYYNFENQRGQSLTHHEFELLSKLNGLDNTEPFYS